MRDSIKSSLLRDSLKSITGPVVSARGSRFPRVRNERSGMEVRSIVLSCSWYTEKEKRYRRPLPPSSPHDDVCAGVHTLREREKCVCFESGIISSIKSGLVPRECSVCVLACSIRDPPPNLGQTPLLDDPRSSTTTLPTPSNFPTTAPTPLPTPRRATRMPPFQMEPNRLIIFV